MDNGKCAVLVPVAHHLEPETEASLQVLARRGYAVRMLRGSSQVDLARSTLATQALRDGFTETMWIDSDTAFDPDHVEVLRKYRLPIVAGLYLRKRQYNPEFAGKFVTPRATFGAGGGLLEMVYVGMGFTLIRSEVYERVADDLPVVGGGYEGKTLVPYFLPLLANVYDKDGRETETREYLSEDYSFCNRARQAGYTIMADTTLRVGHLGRYLYTWDEFAPRKQFVTLELGIPDQRTIEDIDPVSDGEGELPCGESGNRSEDMTDLQAELRIAERMLDRRSTEVLELQSKFCWLVRALDDVAAGRTLPCQLRTNLTEGQEGVVIGPVTPALMAALAERERAIQEYQERQVAALARNGQSELTESTP